MPATRPSVSINRSGPSVATLKLGWVGACRTADTADSAPARPQVMRLTRLTEMRLALRQRNAALRRGRGDEAQAFDCAFAESAGPGHSG